MTDSQHALDSIGSLLRGAHPAAKVRWMPNRLLKRLACTIPYTRRIHDGLEAMRLHISTLEAHAAHVEELARQSATNAERLQAKLDELDPHASQVASGNKTPQIAAVHHIDQAWCDTGGVYVNGWTHAGPHPVRRVVLSCGGERAETSEFLPRRDVIAHYPELPPEGAMAFKVYLACPAYLPLTLSVITDAGSGEMAVRLSPPNDVERPDATPAVEGFHAAMKARKGTVMELGARIVGSMTQSWRARYEPDCRYLGNDIHPGPGIDVVGDVHTLTASVAAGSLDGIFSVAVLEHLAAPWLAAAEINRALKLGGETLHVTHQTWPVHETPNDFFRMSDQALRSLFGSATGFEVIECGMAFPVAIVPPPHMRHSDWLNVPFGRGCGQSYIRARKVAELDQAASLWSAQDLSRISQDYPRPKPG